MRLSSLKIENFRSLENFTVESIGNVNLIVGKNNSGKSTVLEALRLFAGRGNPPLLADIAHSHDERYESPEIGRELDSWGLPFEHFFTGRKFPEDDKVIFIGDQSDRKNGIEIGHIYISETEETTEDDDGTELTRIKREVIPKNNITNSQNYTQSIVIRQSEKQRFINLDSNDTRLRRKRFPSFDSSDIIPCSFIPTQFVSVDELADLWDKVLFTEQEDFVKQGLQIISPDFENIAFVKNDSEELPYRQRRESSPRSAKVKLSSSPYPIPLNSMGDGMLRVLQLILKAFPAKGGIMLIDEFENGLHYSVQIEVWKLLFKISELFDIQIFASTHSWDCIESFAAVAQEEEEASGVLFRVGKSVRNSDKGKAIATVYTKEKLSSITQAEVEVR